ncbi:MAG TPA: hypothetical protein VM618_03125 [Acidimicrobiia bacterium]|nr:hypothetical protein [Acidimicrobiia bacterium]
MDAFDADVLIYAAVRDHPLGRRVRALFPLESVETTGVVAGVASVLLIPELLTKPFREAATDELDELGALLGRLDLRPVDEATAVAAGADRFLTNNRSDFPKTITEIEITYPDDLTPSKGG